MSSGRMCSLSVTDPTKSVHNLTWTVLGEFFMIYGKIGFLQKKSKKEQGQNDVTVMRIS